MSYVNFLSQMGPDGPWDDIMLTFSVGLKNAKNRTLV